MSGLSAKIFEKVSNRETWVLRDRLEAASEQKNKGNPGEDEGTEGAS